MYIPNTSRTASIIVIIITIIIRTEIQNNRKEEEGKASSKKKNNRAKYTKWKQKKRKYELNENQATKSN